MVEYLYHYLGIRYEKGKEKVVWHQQRIARDDYHANQILTSMSLAFGSKVSCINMLTDEEYKKWKKEREEKGAWKVRK